MKLRAIPGWLRFSFGLGLILLAGYLAPSGLAVLPLIVGVPLLVSARLQAFSEANDESLRRKARRGSVDDDQQ